MQNNGNKAEDYWFRQRRYGYGGYPDNWKGWAASIGFLVAFLAWTACMLLPLWAQGQEPGSARWMLWLSVGLIAAFLFARFSRKRTRGGWSWHWGGKPLGRHMDH